MPPTDGPPLLGRRRANDGPRPAQASADPAAPSKTRRKAESQARQDLGETLVGVDAGRLSVLAAEVALPERLVEAIAAARGIRAWGARKRQLQYIGKLMRDVDPAPIERRLDAWAQGHAVDTASQHALERWRDRLLSEPDALDALAAQYPTLDRPRFRSLIARARRARARRGAACVSRTLPRAQAARRAGPLNAARTCVAMPAPDSLLIGLVSISDRASAGVYADQGIPGLVEWFTAALTTPWRMETRLIPDERPGIERTLIELVDVVGCPLVLTTGGTGPAPRDVTPEATLAVAHKVLPGFGEQMREVSLKYVPTAILSRQVGVVRGRSLILNLPGQPKAIKETLDGIFAAVPYCLDLIGGPYIETDAAVCKAFRPKSAQRPPPGGA